MIFVHPIQEVKKVILTLGIGVLCFAVVIFSSFTSSNKVKSNWPNVENRINVNLANVCNSKIYKMSPIFNEMIPKEKNAIQI